VARPIRIRSRLCFGAASGAKLGDALPARVIGAIHGGSYCYAVHGCFCSQSFWKAGSERNGSQSGSSLRRAGVMGAIIAEVAQHLCRWRGFLPIQCAQTIVATGSTTPATDSSANRPRPIFRRQAGQTPCVVSSETFAPHLSQTPIAVFTAAFARRVFGKPDRSVTGPRSDRA
jgi:hypothetical protein